MWDFICDIFSGKSWVFLVFFFFLGLIFLWVFRECGGKSRVLLGPEVPIFSSFFSLNFVVGVEDKAKRVCVCVLVVMALLNFICGIFWLLEGVVIY